jgi:phosphoglycolate phosphatase-like HAD superfamily hydrolase
MDRPIIYFDLDGVLADFEKGFHRMTGIDLALLGPDAFADKETKDAVFQHPTFFLDLELMPGAKDLVNYAQGFQADIKVLTATGYSNEDAVDAQKRAWVKKHFGDLEVHTVPKSEMKAKFAWPIETTDSKSRLSHSAKRAESASTTLTRLKQKLSLIEYGKKWKKSQLLSRAGTQQKAGTVNKDETCYKRV